MPTDRDRWAEEQIAAFIDMGDSPADAERFVALALSWVPEGEDPATYLPPAHVVIASATVTDEDVADARADWYASEDVPNAWKRLLDAREVVR